MPGIDILATAFNGANAAFIADLYARWVQDPSSVDPSFAQLFAALNDEARAVLTDASGASWAPRHFDVTVPEPPKPAGKKDAKGGVSAEQVRAAALDSLRALLLIRAYRDNGHRASQLDPLGLQHRVAPAELDPATYGFTPADLDRPVFINKLALRRETVTVRELVDVLKRTYCGAVGVEFSHLESAEQRQWIISRMEGAPWTHAVSADEKRMILQQITEAEGFEVFCQKKYVGMKRFGLEGGEVTIPALHAIIGTAVQGGVKEVAIGMPHRGRLNTLVNVVRKPFQAVFSEFGGVSFKPDDVQGSGDVKYHLGISTDIELAGQSVHISLQPNPSHLEAVDPVVAGKVRARQDEAGDLDDRRSVLGILLHGDAAFAGQGVVYETLAMSKLKGYRTGGTLHVVVNNQIGFTTLPTNAFSGLYGTDVAKSVQSPIFHVNGDQPEAVVFVSRLAAEFRNTFASDVVLDIVCYRRHGHNESDEPAFTQPLMYKAINAQRSTRTVFAERLAAEGAVDAATSQKMWDDFHAAMEDAFKAGQSYKPNKADWLEGHWQGLKPESEKGEHPTALPLATLKEIGAALSTVPGDFNANSKIVRQLEAKRTAIETGEGIDWATGEALGFGGLLLEGHRVRLSGEDCQRGTFSQRHAVLIDQANQGEYTPLNNIRAGQAKIEIVNSLLSEMAVLGFEYGYSVADPQTLVLWEGQFGDFANGAQVIIDQFIASGETKWLRMSGLVMLLPHGYEGQGPEHSSARLERYLQMCAEHNMWVCNLTTPANYFHALRRQLKRDFRKPLILMTPKSLLRHKLAVSPLADMAEGTSFRPVIDEIDPIVAGDKVKRVVICTGKVYYDLLAEKREKGVKDVAVVRLEQMYPFPDRELAKVVGTYKNAEVIWCQEEPENMGAWTFVDRRIENVLVKLGGKATRPRFAGRDAAASPATGLAKTHAAEQAALVRDALGLN